MGNQWEGSDPRRTTTPQHREWSKAVLGRDRYTCQIRGPRCTGKATEADHIVPDTEGGGLTLSNGQAVCKPCHLQKTGREANLKRHMHTTNRPAGKHPGLL